MGKLLRAPADFLRGLLDPWRALAFLLRRPSLWALAALPFVASLCLYGGAIWGGWRFADSLISRELLEPEGWWRHLVGYLAATLFWLGTLLASAFLFIPAATILANPINDLLSQRTERLYRGLELDQPFSMRLLFRSIRVGLAGQLGRAATMVFLLFICFLVGFVPVVGQSITPVASTLVTISYLSLEYTGFSMDRRLYTWRQKRAFLRAHRARTLGFGSMAMLIMMTPVANALFIPLSAVAGTMLFCDVELEGAAPPPLPSPDDDDLPPPLPPGFR